MVPDKFQSMQIKNCSVLWDGPHFQIIMLLHTNMVEVRHTVSLFYWREKKIQNPFIKSCYGGNYPIYEIREFL
jgi:hypothetical protein